MKPLWTIDGIDFLPFEDAAKVAGGATRLVEWCKSNGAIVFPWNAAESMSAPYSEACMAADAAEVQRVVVVGYNDPTGGTDWLKEKAPTPP